MCYRYVSSWEVVEEGGEDMRWREGDPAAAFSLLRHIGLGWTTVDQALHQANSALEGIGELLVVSVVSSLLPTSATQRVFHFISCTSLPPVQQFF